MVVAADLTIADARFAVVDIETTGLRAGWDRIVEIAVMHWSVGEAPYLAFDSVIRPMRAVDATHIHGITSLELVTAPTLEHVVGNISRALVGRVVVVHNAGLDLRFLEVELERAGLDFAPPFLDTLPLVPAVGAGPRAALHRHRAERGIPNDRGHIAAFDVMTTCLLLQESIQRMRSRGMVHLGELVHVEGCESFSGSLRRETLAKLDRVEGMTQSRAARHGLAGDDARTPPAQAYSEALMIALGDGLVTDEELSHLESVRDDAGVFGEQLRAIHAHALAWLLQSVAADQVVTAREERIVGGAMRALKELDWSPSPTRMRGSRPGRSDASQPDEAAEPA